MTERRVEPLAPEYFHIASFQRSKSEILFSGGPTVVMADGDLG